MLVNARLRRYRWVDSMFTGIKKDEASQTASESSAAVHQEGGVSSSSDETVVAGDERHDAKGQDSTIADGAFDSSQSVAPDAPDLGLVPDSGAPAGGDVIEPEQPQEDDYEILDNLYLSRWVDKGESIDVELPHELNLRRKDGSVEVVPVTWKYQNWNMDRPGIEVIDGIAKSVPGGIHYFEASVNGRTVTITLDIMERSAGDSRDSIASVKPIVTTVYTTGYYNTGSELYLGPVDGSVEVAPVTWKYQNWNMDRPGIEVIDGIAKSVPGGIHYFEASVNGRTVTITLDIMERSAGDSRDSIASVKPIVTTVYTTGYYNTGSELYLGPVNATMSNGEQQSLEVKWDKVPKDLYDGDEDAGEFTVHGVIERYGNYPVEAKVVVAVPRTQHRMETIAVPAGTTPKLPNSERYGNYPVEAKVVVAVPRTQHRMETIAVPAGTTPKLPNSVYVEFSNGMSSEVNVDWDMPGSDAFAKAGIVYIKGSIPHSKLTAQVKVKVDEVVTIESELVRHALVGNPESFGTECGVSVVFADGTYGWVPVVLDHIDDSVTIESELVRHALVGNPESFGTECGVSVVFADGTYGWVPVVLDHIDDSLYDTPGTYQINGKLKEYGNEVKLKLVVHDSVLNPVIEKRWDVGGAPLSSTSNEGFMLSEWNTHYYNVNWNRGQLDAIDFKQAGKHVIDGVIENTNIAVKMELNIVGIDHVVELDPVNRGQLDAIDFKQAGKHVIDGVIENTNIAVKMELNIVGIDHVVELDPVKTLLGVRPQLPNEVKVVYTDGQVVSKWVSSWCEAAASE